MSRTEVRRLAKQLNELQRRLNGLQAPQLINASIEDGAIYGYDPYGNNGYIIGKQDDGGYGFNPLLGPIPPVPAPPTVEPSPGMFNVIWDGQFFNESGVVDPMVVAPSDFAMVEVHVGTTADFTPEIHPGSVTRSGGFTNAGGGQHTHLPVEGPGTYFVRLVSASTAGRYSEPCEAVEVTIEPLVDLTELQDDLDQLREDLDAAALEIAETGAELTDRLEQAEQNLAAADAAITELETVTLPNLQQQLSDAADWIDTTGTELNNRLGNAENDLAAAEGRLDDAEDALNTAFPSGAFNVNSRFSQTIKTSVVQYAVNASETNAPTTGWSTTQPTRTPGTFVWFRTVITYGDDTTNTTSAALLTGNTGAAGATGVGITSITPFYQQKSGAAPSKPTAATPNANWSTTEPSWVSGQSLYRTERIVYTNDTYVYTDVTKVASYEGIDAAMTAANGKNMVTYTDVTAANKPGPNPTTGMGTGRAQWDIHRNRNASTGEVYAEWRWSGSSWQTVNYGDEILRSLDVGKLTAGTANIQNAVVQKIAAESAQFINLDVKNLISTNTTMNQAVIDQLWTDVLRAKKITTDMLVVGNGQNLVPDPGFLSPQANAFRTGYGPWRLGSHGGGPGGQPMTTNDNSGTADLPLWTEQNEWWEVSNNAVIVFSALVQGPSDQLSAYLQAMKSDGTVGTTTFRPLTWDSAGRVYASWDLMELESWIGGRVAAVRVAVRRTAGSSNFYSFVSSPRVTVATDASMIVDGAIAARHINAESIGAAVGDFVKVNVKDLISTNATLNTAVVNQLWTDVVRSRKITTDMLLVGPGINMILDPLFGDTSLSAERIAASSGTWSVLSASAGVPVRFRCYPAATQSGLHLRGSTNDWYSVIEPGKRYRIRFRAYTHATGNSMVRAVVRVLNFEGSSAFVAADQTAYQAVGKGVGNWTWHEYTWTAPTDAVGVYPVIQVQGGAATFTDFANPTMTIDGASLIVDGTIGADKIIANSIGTDQLAANSITTDKLVTNSVTAAKIQAGQINVDHLQAGTLSASNIESGTLSAVVTVSGTIQTATSGQRTVMNSSGLVHYDTFGVSDFKVDGSGVAIRGELQTGSALSGVVIAPYGAGLGNGIIEFRSNTINKNPNMALVSSLNSEGSAAAALTISGPAYTSNVTPATITIDNTNVTPRRTGINLDANNITLTSTVKAKVSGSSVELSGNQVELDAPVVRISGNTITGEWATFVPTLTSTGTNPTVTNNTHVGRFRRIGRSIFFTIEITIGSAFSPGTGNYIIGLPSLSKSGITQIAAGHVILGSSEIPMSCKLEGGSTIARSWLATGVPLNASRGWATGDKILVSGTYEASSG